MAVSKMTTSELYHYGVKGMKWGVRRYQDANGRLTSAGKQHQKDERVRKVIEQYAKNGKAHVDNLSHYEVGSLLTATTKTGEKYVTGLTSGHDFDWREKTVADGVEFSPGQLISFSRDIYGTNPYEYPDDFLGTSSKDIAAAHSRGSLHDRDLETCNLGFGQPGTVQNCAKCSASLEMKLRGYNIGAGRQTWPSSADAMSLWFDGAKRVDYDYDSAEKALTSYGPKTSGSLSFLYPGANGGHAVHWTNDSSGRFEIQDGQNGRRFSSLKEMMTAYGGDTSRAITTFRLDNCEPNYSAMDRDSVMRGTYLRNENSRATADTWAQVAQPTPNTPPPVPQNTAGYDYRKENRR